MPRLGLLLQVTAAAISAAAVATVIAVLACASLVAASPELSSSASA